MIKKGRLQPGMDADIVIFDPDEITEVGTYQDPNHPAVGVHWVLVNGQAVVRDAELVLYARAGRPIRRATN